MIVSKIFLLRFLVQPSNGALPSWPVDFEQLLALVYLDGCDTFSVMLRRKVLNIQFFGAKENANLDKYQSPLPVGRFAAGSDLLLCGGCYSYPMPRVALSVRISAASNFHGVQFAQIRILEPEKDV